MIKFLFLATGLLSFVPAHAYEPDQALSNFASDLATCTAFYSLIGEGLKKQNPDLSASLLKSASVTYSMSVSASNEDVTIARAQMYAKSMSEEVEGDMSNMPVLMARYSEMCKEIIEDPEKRMDYWLSYDR